MTRYVPKFSERFLPVAFIWTLLLMVSLAWSIYSERQEYLQSASAEVRAYHNSVLLLRNWVAKHGGVYVPIQDDTPPNPYLRGIPERDIQTPAGKALTLINPAYMTRQVLGEMRSELSVQGKLTSLKPLNPINEPDEWERKALLAFERGEVERREITSLNGEEHIRLIRPLRVEATCLGCHRQQGYQVGDVRGGLSTSMPLTAQRKISQAHNINVWFAHTGLWLIGLLGLRSFWRRLTDSRQQLEVSLGKLERNETRLHEAQSIVRMGNWEWIIATGELHWSPEIFRIFGVDPKRYTPSYQGFLDTVHPDDRDGLVAAIGTSLESADNPYSITHRIVLPTGQICMVCEQGRVFFDAQGQAQRMVGTVRDITPEWEAALELQRATDAEHLVGELLRLSLQPVDLESFLSDALQLLEARSLLSSPVGCGAIYLVTDDNGTQVALELIGQLHLNDQQRAFGQYLSINGGLWYQVLRNPKLTCIDRVDDSHGLPFEHCHGRGVVCMPLISKGGTLGLMTLEVKPDWSPARFDTNLLERVAEVISLGIARRRAEDESRFHAFYDVLTGLPNRRLLLDRLVREIGVAKRHNSGTAILFIDLDHFKKINDALGHPVGDRLLQETAQRISTILRSEDTCARVGGDEFVVLIPSLQGSSAQMTRKSHHVAEQIRRQLGLPYEMDGRQLRMSVSIGIAIHPDHDDDAGILVRHADTAMYKAKLAGRNCIRFFNPEMQDEVSERLDVELALRSALENNELSLAFQPQIDRQYGLVGAEVLLRWHSASLGMVSPAQFIPIAEDTGLIISIGDWVMRTAMNRARELSEAAHSGGGCRIAINVSQVQFKQRDFVETVVRALADTGVNPCLIELEITESMLVDHVDAAINKIQHLRELGIRFSIDDFGTGYSSLSYLKLLPLDKLKIDQSFVRGVDQDEQDAAIVEAIIAMARHLKLDIIAEGVETEAERDFLAAHGCDKYQGYLYYRPMPWSEFRVLCTGDEPSTANLSSTAESVEP